MKDFVLDVWADLRERRLWPVAALLVLALVAVPVVLVHPAEEAPSQAAAPTVSEAPAADAALLKLTDGKPLVRISSLDQFASKDPFKPIEKLKPIGGADALAGSAGAGASIGTSSGLGAAGGDAGGPPGGPPGLLNRGGGGTGTGGNTGGGQPNPPAVKKYTYVVDLTFGAPGDARRYSSFERLGMLPGQASPLLVYLGVDGTGSHAAFLVDSTLNAAGEGSCRPSATNCGVVYLEPGEKETFDDGQGHTYELVIDQIRRVQVGASSSRSKPRRSGAAHSAGGHPRRFVFPVLIDLETGVHP